MLFSEVIRILAVWYHINLTIMAATFIINMPQMFARAGKTWQNGLTYLPRRLNTCQIIVFKLETWVAGVVQPVTPAGDQVGYMYIYRLRVYVCIYRWTERERQRQRDREREREIERERQRPTETTCVRVYREQRERDRDRETEKERDTERDRQTDRRQTDRERTATVQACHGSIEMYVYITIVGKQKGLGSIPLRLSFLFKKVVVCGHCLVTLSLTINETLEWLSSLPILMQESFCWWQCIDRYISSLFPTSIPPPTPLFPVPNKPYGFCGR